MDLVEKAEGVNIVEHINIFNNKKSFPPPQNFWDSRRWGRRKVPGEGRHRRATFSISSGHR